jgi:hypothetical protein
MLVAALTKLDEHFAGVHHHMGVGEDPRAGDDHARAGALRRGGFGPGAKEVGRPGGDVELHHAVFDVLAFGLRVVDGSLFLFGFGGFVFRGVGLLLFGDDVLSFCGLDGDVG